MTSSPFPLVFLGALIVSVLLVTGCGSSGPAASEETAQADEEPDSVGWKGTANRRPGEQLKNPFRDPTEVGATQQEQQNRRYERPYSRDSLKSTDPLVIPRSGRLPYDDPGVPPITNAPTQAEGTDMMRLPAGTFMMGLTDEDPFDIQYAGRKRVSLSPFYIDQYEVTNEEYRTYLQSLGTDERADAAPDSTVWERGEAGVGWQNYFYNSTYSTYPVVAVTWGQARDYCKWAKRRLPTEAEWEFAARAGEIGGIYPWQGFNVQSRGGQFLANYSPQRQGKAADGYSFTAPVGSYPPSVWGLYDMSGNVAEWVQDTFQPTYQGLSDLNPVNEDPDESRHVVRGGSWASSAFRIGVGLRDFQNASEASIQIGFRCAVDPGNYDRARKKANPEPTAQQQPNSGESGEE